MPYRLSNRQISFFPHPSLRQAWYLFELQHQSHSDNGFFDIAEHGDQTLTAEAVFYLVAALQSVERSVREGTRAEQVLHSPRRVIVRRISRGLVRTYRM